MRKDRCFLFIPSRRRSVGRSTSLVAFGTARLAVIAAVLMGCVAGNCLGVILGARWAERTETHACPENLPLREHVIAELGRLDAALAQLSPRIERVTRNVDALLRLRARTSSPPSLIPEGLTTPYTPPLTGVGGPAIAQLRRSDAHALQRSPGPDTAEVRDQISRISDTMSVLEATVEPLLVAFEATPGRPPVVGAVVESTFGNRIDPFDHQLRFHSGVDYPVPNGSPVLATAGGRVSFTGSKAGYGNLVEIDHGRGLRSRYGHLSRIRVREDEIVAALQRIGDVGSTGRSTGPHLHFEVLLNGRFSDPAAYLSLFAEPDRTGG